MFRPKTTREFIAETVRKAVQEQIDKGRTVGPTVLDRMLKNADNAWARHCQRVGIDIDTPLKSVPLPDDGSAVEYQRAEWCCVPKGQDQSNSVFMCKHGRVYTMLQQPATQQTIDASLQSAATSKHP
ncbi:hypothetical protein B0T20DRAFT_365619 [Sordaria brevicollis]|uniref:Uncharacterized protein n=1 Tax=Sordaria brevicollis TaxID=83679 RepID=A0AAE0NUQ7_SORBR|nr:hypothetical protein B0T20DRAFT_365619 [Sordaria brevicollis]